MASCPVGMCEQYGRTGIFCDDCLAYSRMIDDAYARLQEDWVADILAPERDTPSPIES